MKIKDWIKKNKGLVAILIFILVYTISDYQQKEATLSAKLPAAPVGTSWTAVLARTGATTAPVLTAAGSAVAWYLSPWLIIPVALIFFGPTILSVLSAVWAPTWNSASSNGIPAYIWIILIVILLSVLLKGRK